MKIQSLHLENYRCFENFTLDFDEKLTVLVGVNGVGKTTLLDALAVFLRPVMEKYALPEKRYFIKGMRYSDLCAGSKNNTIHLELKIYGDDHKHVWKFSQDNKDKEQFNPVQEDVAIDNLFHCLKQSHPESTILAYYGAQRHLSEMKDDLKDKSWRSAFRDAFSPNIYFWASLMWFDEKDAEEARKRSNSTDQKDYRNPELDAVRRAVSRAMGDGDTYEFPHMDGVPPKLFINHKKSGIACEVSMLGEGYKTMLAMVMNLAWRMAVANGHVVWPEGQTVLHSPGIVLIDEVELHLHPGWQQTVLPKLMEIFPNVQFIVTTHSPQVLTTVEPQHIRLLQDGQAKMIPYSTYGAQSWRVLEDVLGVPSRPDSEAKEILDEYFTCINQGRGRAEEALALRKQLDEWLDGDPALVQADMLIARAERAKARCQSAQDMAPGHFNFEK
jgi:predicted ATP-binding protein involved in virulence